MKRKKELIVILSSLLVIVLSVSVAYFTTKILGEGKEISVESADLKVIFTSGSGTINGSNIEPGWSSGENTFTVKNESNSTYNYNIVIKDLVNTFTTSGFLVYKITSTDGGYNMTDFADVPKSLTSKDKVLAYNVSIDKDVTHTYTVEFKYLKSEDVDQSADMGKTLTGKIFITKGTEKPTLANQLLNDNPTISTRTSFSTPFTDNTVNTLYKATENGTDVYYFGGVDFVEAHCEYNGNPIINDSKLTESLTKEQCLSEISICQFGSKLIYAEDCENDYRGTTITITDGKWVEKVEKPINNWVKFGKYQSSLVMYRGFYNTTTTKMYKEYSTMEECTSATSYNKNCTEVKYASVGDDIYWRIIRTNVDGSIRLLYSGTNPDTSNGYIGRSSFNSNQDSPKYAGYMYGDDDSTLDGIRANTNDSVVKTYVDNWYENNLTSYTKYLSNDAIYCNDRELASSITYSTSDDIEFKAYERLSTNKTPTYDCVNTKDAFSVNNTEAKLTYPIALMTADEGAFAGGIGYSPFPLWYSTNKSYNSITGYLYKNAPTSWGTMTPVYTLDTEELLLNVFETTNITPGYIGNGWYASDLNGIRPVTSLKSCVQWKSGDGSYNNPYEIVENGGC